MIEDYCPADVTDHCGGTCAGPSEYLRVIGTQVTLNCLEGYVTSSGGSSFTASCIDQCEEAGDWDLEDHCVGILFIPIPILISYRKNKFLFESTCKMSQKNL